jgi:eukaryotic-like serine/threonine-protein kinase
VKPGNVLVTPEGRVKLTDFGIAKAVESRHDDLTAENVMMGTAKYLSPEQVLGFPLDGRADIYSLGLVLYECLTGRAPFSGGTDGAIAVARLQRDPTPIRRIRPAVPAVVADTVMQLLARRPEDRPATALEARQLLTAAAGGRDDETLPEGIVGDTAATPPEPGPSTRPVSRQPGTDPGESWFRRLVQGRARWLVAAVAAVAAVTAGAVAFAARDGGGTASGTTPRDPGAGGQIGSVPATVSPLGSSLVSIASITEFDPPPGDGKESPSAVRYLTDGNPNTAWTTVCYQSKYLYPKDGVGLVLHLTGPVGGQRLTITWPSGPWRVALYTADQPGSTLAAWGEPVATRGSDDPGQASLSLGDSASRYVLVWLTQIARADGCSSNPYRGAIGELAVVAAR